MKALNLKNATYNYKMIECGKGIYAMANAYRAANEVRMKPYRNMCWMCGVKS